MYGQAKGSLFAWPLDTWLCITYEAHWILCIIKNYSNSFRCGSSITEKACHLDVFLLCIWVFLTMCKIKPRMVGAFPKIRGLGHCGNNWVFSTILGFFPPMCFNVCKALANVIMNLKLARREGVLKPTP